MPKQKQSLLTQWGYAQKHGEHCPYCLVPSTEIAKSNTLRRLGEEFGRECECASCGRTYIDVFRLIGFYGTKQGKVEKTEPGPIVEPGAEG